jgi:hypothetical protein
MFNDTANIENQEPKTYTKPALWFVVFALLLFVQRAWLVPWLETKNAGIVSIIIHIVLEVLVFSRMMAMSFVWDEHRSEKEKNNEPVRPHTAVLGLAMAAAAVLSFVIFPGIQNNSGILDAALWTTKWVLIASLPVLAFWFLLKLIWANTNKKEQYMRAHGEHKKWPPVDMTREDFRKLLDAGTALGMFIKIDGVVYNVSSWDIESEEEREPLRDKEGNPYPLRSIKWEIDGKRYRALSEMWIDKIFAGKSLTDMTSITVLDIDGKDPRKTDIDLIYNEWLEEQAGEH